MKLYANFAAQGQSKKHVKMFLETICDTAPARGCQRLSSGRCGRFDTDSARGATGGKVDDETDDSPYLS
ncbi:MAG TPA: hypothetical protein VEK15_10830 [Vicinamibacteria bacterium]|nr:hypothetical protein [Vicinamibacteria bacterium]